MEKSMIRAIFAADEDNGIGKNGTIPWPKNMEDLRWFKKNTDGNIVMMGRKTWDDPMMPKPLPNRYSIVVSDTGVKDGPNMCIGRDSVELYLKLFTDVDKDVWIIGGGRLLEYTLPMCDEVWISRIKGNYNCDVKVALPPQFKRLVTEEYHTLGLVIEKYTK